jgi:hypothetical protein
VYRYQDLTLDSGTVVKDVLVGVAEDTGEVLSIPSQSTPKIKLARSAAKEETFSVRIPRELDDLIWLMAAELGANPAKFGAALIRFYLHGATANASFAGVSNGSHRTGCNASCPIETDTPLGR